VPEPEALSILDSVLEPQRVPTLVHTCANRPPLGFLGRSQAAALGFDLATLAGTAGLDAVGEALDQGKIMVLGMVPTVRPGNPVTWREIAESGARLVDRLGFPRADLARRVTVSPACGLAGASVNWARDALRLASDTAKAFAQDPESLVPQ
jgi:methionine synthase II (cobalamin-independent)